MCWELLDVLGFQSTVTRGRHFTLTPVALPMWLPKTIVDSMMQRFGKHLLVEIQSLMERDRTSSTHSRTPSIQSDAGLSATSDDSADFTGPPDTSYCVISDILD